MLIYDTPYESEEAKSPDESWWTSLLAEDEMDEEESTDDNISIELKTKPAPLSDVDWNFVKRIYKNDEIIQMSVYGYNRGGLLVESDRLQGFVPISHLLDVPNILSEAEKQSKLACYVGRNIRLKVIECEPTLDRIVFSERAALAGEGKRRELFNTLKAGDIVEGKVTNITDFGVFVDLGGVEGLIHVSELSWGRVQHPSDFCKIGGLIKAKVLNLCEQTSRVALSLKQLQPNPWDHLIQIYKPGDTVQASITAILNFGVFARLEEGVEGLIHISSMSLPPNEKNLNKYFSIGQKVKARILHIDPARRRLGLGLVTLE